MFAFVPLMLLVLVVNVSSSIEVETINGKVRGFKQEIISENKQTVNVFLGIPYAQPPVGEKRFRKPEPLIERRNETLEANRWPPVCPQRKGRQYYANQSEDCLYLNIWTPEKSSKLLPVLVWIHGGAFVNFTSSSKYFDGSHLSALGNVVIVTLNYRLGVLGFLAGHSEEAPGNQAFQDQAMALKWVKSNIHNFGGDPSNVTLFGESAGGRSVSLHIFSPSSRNLYHKAIIMSGVAMDDVYVESRTIGIQKAKVLSEKLGCASKELSSSQYTSKEDEFLSKTELRCLRSLPFEEIISAQATLEFSTVSSESKCVGFCPIHGDEYLPLSPLQAFASGDYKKNIPIMIGTVTNEGMILYHRARLVNSSMFQNLKNKQDWLDYTVSVFQEKFPRLLSLQKAVIQSTYFEGIDEQDVISAKAAYMRAVGDAVWNCPTNYFARQLAENNAVYHYLFNYTVYKPDIGPCEVFGPCHGNDVTITFGTSEYLENKAASLEWMKLLLSFAFNGKLEVPEIKATASGPWAYLDFLGTTSKVNTGYRYEQCLHYWGNVAPLHQVGCKSEL